MAEFKRNYRSIHTVRYVHENLANIATLVSNAEDFNNAIQCYLYLSS